MAEDLIDSFERAKKEEDEKNAPTLMPNKVKIEKDGRITFESEIESMPVEWSWDQTFV